MFKLLRRSTAEYHSIKDHRIVIDKVSVMLLLGRRKHLLCLAGENIEKRGFLSARPPINLGGKHRIPFPYHRLIPFLINQTINNTDIGCLIDFFSKDSFSSLPGDHSAFLHYLARQHLSKDSGSERNQKEFVPFVPIGALLHNSIQRFDHPNPFTYSTVILHPSLTSYFKQNN